MHLRTKANKKKRNGDGDRDSVEAQIITIIYHY